MTRRPRFTGVIAVAVGLTVGVSLATALLVVAGNDNASAVDLPQVARQMAVFQTPPLDPSAVPSAVRSHATALSRSGGYGTPIEADIRRVADSIGVNGAAMYAVPATGGAVCIIVAERTHAATCVDRFSRDTGSAQALIYSGESTPPTFAGIASDDVVAVAVLVNGVTRMAKLARNAFHWQGDPSITREKIDTLLITQSDGHVVHLNLDFS